MGTMRTRKLHTAIQWIPGTVVTIEMISPTLETEERGFFFFASTAYKKSKRSLKIILFSCRF